MSFSWLLDRTNWSSSEYFIFRVESDGLTVKLDKLVNISVVRVIPVNMDNYIGLMGLWEDE